MKEYECVIVGGGVVGCAIFSELVRNSISCALIEKYEDVALGATKANSGLIHAGYDCAENTLKARFNVRGNQLYPAMARRLGEKFIKTGSLVVSNEEGLSQLKALKLRGENNGVKGLSILGRKKLLKLEPNLSKNIQYGLYAESAGIVSPYNIAIALCEEAILNGGDLYLNYKIQSITNGNSQYEITDGKQTFKTRYIINCAGAEVNVINSLVGEKLVDLHYTKGEYILLDKTEGELVHRAIFPLPTKAGKGILVAPTASGNIICGPTAVDVDSFDTSVSSESIAFIKSSTSQMIDNINFRKAIKFYAGVRVKYTDDFVIQFSFTQPRYCMLAGIASPGLTSAPAIAEYILKELIRRGVVAKKRVCIKRKPYTNITKMPTTKLNELIAKNKNYGKIVCRCETISQGEIEEVLRGVIKPLTIEGVKRRLRPTMGRCQGSFCLPVLTSIIASTYKIDMKDVVQKGSATLVQCDIKENGIYENN